MVEDVELLYSRMRLESDKFLDLTLYKTEKQVRIVRENLKVA
jgi:hypothetical protein